MATILRSRRFWFALVAVSGVAALVALMGYVVLPLVGSDLPSSYTLVAQTQGRTVDFFAADVNNDGRVELIRLRETYIVTEGRAGRALAQKNFERLAGGEISRVVDLNGNGTSEILFRQEYPDRVRFLCWWDLGDTLEVVHQVDGVDVDQSGRLDVSITLQAIVDLESDGIAEGLFFVATAADRPETGHDRYLLAVQMKPRFPVVWKKPIAPWLGPIEVGDTNGDGEKEILVSTYAIGNGASLGDTDDLHSYEMLLNRSGEYLVLEERGGEFSRVRQWIADLDGDGKVEWLRSVVTGEDDAPGESLALEIADPRSGETLLEKPFAFRDNGIEVVDADRDGRAEIYLTQSVELFRLDETLTVVNRYTADGQINLKETGDIDGDGRIDLIADVAQHTVVVLDPDLEPLLRQSFPDRTVFADFVPPDLDHGPRLLLADRTSPEKIHWILYGIESSAGTTPGTGLPWSVWVLTLSWIGALIFGLYWLRARPDGEESGRAWEAVERLPATVALIDGRGNLLRVNPFGARWLASGTTPGAPLPTWLGGERLADLRRAVARFLRGQAIEDAITIRSGVGSDQTTCELGLRRTRPGAETVIVVQDRTMESKSRQALEWAAIAQELIHDQVKNPLGTILLAVRRMEQDLERIPQDWIERNRSLLKTIASEVSRMDQSCRTFLRFTRLREVSFAAVEPEKVIARLEARVREGFDGAQRFDVSVGEDLPALHADPDQLEWMLENLVTNARQSLDGKPGSVTLNAYARDQVSDEGHDLGIRREVLVEVTDTGEGIAEEQRGKIFGPFFTLKPGGSGLGLAIVQQIVEIHGGRIDLDSKVGLGTRFTVVLPAHRPGGAQREIDDRREV